MSAEPAPQAGPTSSGQLGGRGASTRMRLRQAAREAFDELGWQATRVQDVVARAGVSHGTFYTYYANKAAVLDDLVRVSQADLVALAAERWEADDVGRALRSIVEGLVGLYRRDSAVIRSWLDAAREERQFSDLYVEVRALYIERVAENLDAVAAVAEHRIDVPSRTLAAALVAMVEHLCYCWLVLGEEHEHDDVIDAVVLVWGQTLNSLAGFELVAE